MMPRFSLIVPTRNRIKTLTLNLRRLTVLAEAVPGGAEIIVVDNGSDDGTPELVRSHFPRVRLIELEENRSTAARNVQPPARVRHLSSPGAASGSSVPASTTKPGKTPNSRWVVVGWPWRVAVIA